MNRVATIVLAVLVLTAVPAFAADIIVGGSSGWTPGFDYKTWISGQTFNVGDNLVFPYSSLHTLEQVNKADYDACFSRNSLKSYTDGNTTIALTSPGTLYFVCGTGGHCAAGMKLAVAVAGSSSTPTTSAPSTPIPSPPTPSAPTPSTLNPSTPTLSIDSNAAVTGGNPMVFGGLVVGVVALFG